MSVSLSNYFTIDGESFRDLDHDGILSPFEDWRLTPHDRAIDLVSRLSLDEKIGLLLHGTLRAEGPLGIAGIGETYDTATIADLMNTQHISSAISRLGVTPRRLAELHNELQALAARTRFSIPLSISTDPRNHFSALVGASVASDGFTKFPEFLGLGATDDESLVEAIGEVIRREYRAVGFHIALSPQADLATEPRWSRAIGTFGSNPARVSPLVGAYVRGAQGGAEGVTSTGVACVVKHWVGYGASLDGFDGHNSYGRFCAFPAGRFQDHVDAFAGAFAVNVAGVMPTYTISQGLEVLGREVEQVGGGFSKTLLTDLLRGQHGYDGLIVSDWSIVKDATSATLTGEPPQGPRDIAMPWGVENLSRAERYALALNAGIDQLGGEEDATPFHDAIAQGLLSVERITDAARRVLEQKFALGLFENPFVDVDAVAQVMQCDEHLEVSRRAQRASLVEMSSGDLRIRDTDVVYCHGLDDAAFAAQGLQTTTDLTKATVGIVHLTSPRENLHPNFFFGNMMHEGSLDFREDDPDVEALANISASVPSIAIIFCVRTPTIGVVDQLASRVIGEWGLSDAELVQVLRSEQPLSGHAPVARPNSMEAVLAHPGDAFDLWG